MILKRFTSKNKEISSLELSEKINSTTCQKKTKKKTNLQSNQKKERKKNIDGTSYFKDGPGAEYGLLYAAALASLLR